MTSENKIMSFTHGFESKEGVGGQEGVLTGNLLYSDGKNLKLAVWKSIE